MNKLILFHGTPDKIVVPTYGKGEEKHDYGQGFYLTDSIDLAKEFVRDNIDIDILEELLLLGGLGIQYCIKSELAYSKYYLNDVVENQGKLFDFVAQNFPNMDTEDFINVYMQSKTRKSIDEAKAYVNTMSAKELWEYFIKTEGYSLKAGNSLKGFMPDWIGEFYAYYQWYYNISSYDVIKKVPLDFLKKAYYGLHDLELDLAVKKVGEV